MNRSLIALFCILFSYSSWAQETRVTGTVVADSSLAGIGQYAIFSLPDSTLRKGGYLDTAFALEDYLESDVEEATGASRFPFETTINTRRTREFYLRVTAFGYRDTLIPFSTEDTVVELGDIHLQSNTDLDEVKVTHIKPMFTRTMDGIKVNVDGTNLQLLNNLFDVLVASPKLSSPDDESIEIIGKGSPLILVDRQPILSNEELKAIPASGIGSIQIITNPSAKYKAQGSGSGVIEVYTKNYHLEGYNMNVSGSGGISTKVLPSGSLGLGLNYKRNKFSLNGYVSTNYEKLTSIGSGSSITTDSTSRTSTSEYEGFYNNLRTYYNLKAAVNLAEDHLLTLGTNGRLSFHGNDFTSSQQYAVEEVVQTHGESESSGNDTWLNNGAYMNYSWETDTNHSSLEVNLNYTRKSSSRSSESFSEYTNAIGTDPSRFDIRRDNREKPNLGELRADYRHYFDTSGWQLKVGGAYSLLYNGQRYDQYEMEGGEWLQDQEFSNSYDYDEHIAGLYTELSKKWDKFGFQIGMRGEYTKLYGYSHSLDRKFMDSNYVLPFPSATLMFEPTEKFAITTSYSSGIRRPEFSNFDPFVRFTDSLNVSVGNPYLLPNYTHSASLEFDVMSAYSFSVNYSWSDNPVSVFGFIEDSTFRKVTMSSNAEKSQSIGANMVLPLQLSWLRGYNSLWINYGKYNFTPEFGRAPQFTLTYGVYSSLTFILPKGFQLINHVFLSRWDNPVRTGNTTVSWSIRGVKKFMDGDFQVYVAARNIIPPKSIGTSRYGNYQMTNESQYQFTSFTLGFHAKFGRLKRATSIKESSSKQSGRI